MFWLDFGARGRENIANSAVLFLVGAENNVNYNAFGAFWYLGGRSLWGRKRDHFLPHRDSLWGRKGDHQGLTVGQKRWSFPAPQGLPVIISCPTGTPCGAEKIIISYTTGNYLTWRQQQQQQIHIHIHIHKYTYTNRNYDLVPGSIAGFAKPINILEYNNILRL